MDNDYAFFLGADSREAREAGMTDQTPVALFVYNRPTHTRRTVETLKKNIGADQTNLYIYSDAPKSDSESSSVQDVRNYLNEITGFKQVNIIERINNYGLAKSIIGGVTELCDKYGKVIVLEDDLETSPYFLRFMNDALVYYETKPEVMHISGCRYPVEPFEKSETFFLHVPLCWGWGTWQSSWSTFQKNTNVMQKFDRKMIRHFDFDNSYSYWRQLESNKAGELNTWFVFWYTTVFLRGGLSLFPARSLVRNIGHDDSGVNCSTTTEYDVVLAATPVQIEDIPLCESLLAYEEHRKYFRKLKGSLLTRLVRKIRRELGL